MATTDDVSFDDVESGQLIGRQAISADLVDNGNPCIDDTGMLRHSVVQAAKESTDNASMSASFIIVTHSKQLNLYGNRVQLTSGPKGNGLQTGYHENAPVVRLEHGNPIGLARSPQGKYSVKLTASKGTSTVWFSKSADGEATFALVEEDILGMASIGFYADKALKLRPPKEYNTDDEGDVTNFQAHRLGLWYIVESLLLEWSVTASGADPGALKQCLDRGHIGGARFSPMMSLSLTPFADTQSAWSCGFGAGRVSAIASLASDDINRIEDNVLVSPPSAPLFPRAEDVQSAAAVDTDGDIGTNMSRADVETVDIVAAYQSLAGRESEEQMIAQAVAAEVSTQCQPAVDAISVQLAPVVKSLNETAKYFQQVGLMNNSD